MYATCRRMKINAKEYFWRRRRNKKWMNEWIMINQKFLFNKNSFKSMRVFGLMNAMNHNLFMNEWWCCFYYFTVFFTRDRIDHLVLLMFCFFCLYPWTGTKSFFEYDAGVGVCVISPTISIIGQTVRYIWIIIFIDVGKKKLYWEVLVSSACAHNYLSVLTVNQYLIVSDLFHIFFFFFFFLFFICSDIFSVALKR